jgi:sialate O-acetylesterase
MSDARKTLFSLLLAAVLAAPSAARAEVRLAGIFGDHMVVQMGREVPVWGWADPGERVTVYFNDFQVETTGGSDGRWMVKVGPFGVGGPYDMLVAGSNTLRLTDVMVGEVWLCSGQSNMAMEVRHSKDAEEEMAASANQNLRQFFVPRKKAGTPQDTLARPSQWQIAGPETVGPWTAVGYFFARDLQQRLGVPVGIINCAWGGTVIEAWTSREALDANPKTKEVFENWPSYNDDESWLGDQYKRHLEEVEKAKAEGQEPPVYFNQPTVLFNGMVAPVIPYAIRGATWYQGESNAYRAYQYRDLLPTMITDWRARFGVGEFPFLVVQLANFNAGDEVWPELREAQALATSLPNTALAVADDVGEAEDIHPKDKQTVGLRLAIAARHVAYLEDIEYSGPVYESMSTNGNQVTISFSHTGDGLVTRDGAVPAGFVIAGADQQFVPALARLEGNNVVVWSDQVSSPVAVRFAWRDNPEDANLYNLAADGVRLPAVPFRTDDWTGKTADNR